MAAIDLRLPRRARTARPDYAVRLARLQRAWWKRLLPVQAPYRWNLRRQRLGRTLDIGCGIGRMLGALDAGSIGIDHNPVAVRLARAKGLRALDGAEWLASAERRAGRFDSLLVAHVVEHMDEAEALALLAEHLPVLRPGGSLFLICPQERGHASDPTHVRFMDADALARLAVRAGLVPQPATSFPFPRWAGRLFIYNETCLRATKPG